MSSYYRGSVWCPYCGFTDSQMLESVMGSGEFYGNICPCACLVDTQDYEWPLNPLLIYGKNGNPRLPMEMEAALSAPPSRNKVYPVAKVHPLWLQTELMRLFPETLDDEARQMGIEDVGQLGPVGSYNAVSPWTQVSDVEPREGRLPPSPFGPVGSPVLMNTMQQTRLLASPSPSDETVPWPPSPCPSPGDDDTGYPYPRGSPPGSTTTEEEERGPRPGPPCKSGRSARRYPPKPPRFATKKRFRMY